MKAEMVIAKGTLCIAVPFPNAKAVEKTVSIDTELSPS